ncbi:MAG: helix-turn-helix transcriptional regulator [Arenimonas sp.]|nr:helix-turn-helix transcriptional regulator [Arenimonas sp.]MBP6626084.1 helix-turn-helix transcriptional regulator [Arenimonas sp.]
MNAWITALQATALSLSLLWLALALFEKPRTPLAAVWALFCGSIAMMMASQLLGAGTWSTLLGLGACFTCNGFWLVARALFRPGRPFGAPHLAYAGAVAALIVLSQLQALLLPPLAAAIDELLTLLSSAALVMALWEGLRGWQLHVGMERTLRAVFVVAYGGCVGAVLLVPALLDPDGSGNLQAATAAAAAATILLVTQGLVTYRRLHPALAQGAMTAPPIAMLATEMPAAQVKARARRQGVEAAPEFGSELVALARALEQHMRLQRPYLQPELGLGPLAQALGVPEYRISRAIHGPLRQRNVSAYVCAYRLDHARRLLADPANDEWSTLVVGLESGFGSLGAFHRAFKAAEGCTPGECRAARRALEYPTQLVTAGEPGH